MSSLKQLYMISPYNEEDMSLLKDYCNRTNQAIEPNLIRIKDIYTEEQYKKYMELDVIEKKFYYTKKEKEIVNLFYIEIEKDKKVATLYPQIGLYIRDLIPELCTFLLETENMEEVFVFVNKNDKKTITNLLESSFQSLTTKEDQDDIPFLKEREREKERESSRNRRWNL